MLSLHTSSSIRNKRIPALLLSFVVFIIYCIYIISNNAPSTVNKINNDILPTQSGKKPKIDVCKTDQVLRNVDPNHTNAHLEFWNHLSDATTEAYKQKWQRFIATIKNFQVPRWETERGIVLVAGNKDTFQRALTAIEILRDMHGCQLDIEVWHLSDEQPSAEMKTRLESLDAKPRDLSDPQLVRPITLRRDAEKQ